MAEKSNTSSANSKTTKTSGVRVFKRNAQTKTDPRADYTDRVQRWDDATLNHCLDMIEEGRLTMPFKINVIETEAESRGLGSFETA